MRRQLIIDCETTSLTPSYADGTGTIWELGIMDAATGEAHLYRMKPDVAKADPGALRVGRYYERTAEMCTRCTPGGAHDLTRPLLPRNDPEWSGPAAVAAVVAPMLDDVTLLISVPTFDVPYLKAFLAANGQALTSHHRARDICSMAHGWLMRQDDRTDVPDLDAGTDVYARALGLNTDDYEAHTALGDCEFVRDMYRVITGSRP